jgi:23S rRNA (uracil1939-C5)-methyltransferase
MVVLVTNGESLPNRDELVGLLRESIPGLKSICQNVNKEKTNVIMGRTTRVIWGEETIRDSIGDVQFLISARSFYQVNPVQTEVLYQKAVEFAQLTGSETVVDAYCGIGTISLFLAKHAGEVYGVEIVPEAIADAKRNAALNGIHNATFEVGDAGAVLSKWRTDGVKADVVVVDPPRKGCESELLDAILEMAPKRVVYVSCSPGTLARDLAVLAAGGYQLKEVQPVDMFPHTVHVETVVWLEKK